MMISTKSLIVVVLVAICFQSIECQNVNGNKPLEMQNAAIRGLKEVIQQIKISARSSFNFLKKVAADTRAKISEWANGVRQYAVEVERAFEDQLKGIQKKLNDIITDLIGTSDIARECIRKEGKNIRDVLTEILRNMSKCVSDQIKNLMKIRGKDENLIMNETQFKTDLDNKLEACESDQEHYEDCLYTVRELVYEDLQELDNNIQKTSLESRNLANDVRETLASCSLQNLADASSYITAETMEIVRCVMESKNINEGIIE